MIINIINIDFRYSYTNVILVKAMPIPHFEVKAYESVRFDTISVNFNIRLFTLNTHKASPMFVIIFTLFNKRVFRVLFSLFSIN